MPENNSYDPLTGFYIHFQKPKNENLAWARFATFCKIGCPLNHDFSLPMVKKENLLETYFGSKKIIIGEKIVKIDAIEADIFNF